VLQQLLEVPAIAKIAKHRHRKRRQLPPPQLLVARPHEVCEQEREARHEAGDVRDHVGRRLEQRVKRGRRTPALGCVADDGGDDEWKRSAVQLVVGLPDPHEVHEHAQRHVRVVGALVLHQQVEQQPSISSALPWLLSLAAMPEKLDREQQIRVASCELGIDERACLALDGLPVDHLDELWREHLPKQRCGILW
jgi:hypothetical protein